MGESQAYTRPPYGGPNRPETLPAPAETSPSSAAAAAKAPALGSIVLVALRRTEPVRVGPTVTAPAALVWRPGIVVDVFNSDTGSIEALVFSASDDGGYSAGIAQAQPVHATPVTDSVPIVGNWKAI